MAGREGKRRFCRRDGTVGSGFDVRTGQDGGRFPRRDRTVKCNGRYFLGGTGLYESTVSEIVTGCKGTGPRFHFDDGFTVPSRPVSSRPVVTVNTVPSTNHEKP